MSWWGPPQPAASSAESSVSSSELIGGVSGSVRNMCMPPRSDVSPRSHGPTPSHPQYRSQGRRPKGSEAGRLLDQLCWDDRDREGRGGDERLGAANEPVVRCASHFCARTRLGGEFECESDARAGG